MTLVYLLIIVSPKFDPLTATGMAFCVNLGPMKNLFSLVCRLSEVDFSLVSGVHSIMMVKAAQPGEGGECPPSPFHSIYHHKQTCGVRYAPAERADP